MHIPFTDPNMTKSPIFRVRPEALPRISADYVVVISLELTAGLTGRMTADTVVV